MSFKEIEIMSEKSFKKLVKNKTEKAAFKYTQDEKQKQTKIALSETGNPRIFHKRQLQQKKWKKQYSKQGKTHWI